MSGPTPRDGDPGWLRYDGDQTADPTRLRHDAPDAEVARPTARSSSEEAHIDAQGDAPHAAHVDPRSRADDDVDGETYGGAHDRHGDARSGARSGADDDVAVYGAAHERHGGAHDRHGGADDDAHDGSGGDDEEHVSGLAVLGAAIKEFAIVVGMALVLSFIVKTWLLQAFYIPSGSMEDTLVLNDRVIVSKLTPGPIDLRRGDIIVFADPGHWLDETPPAQQGPIGTVVTETLTFVGLLPDNAENHLIKRVIGLPGDHVVCCDEGGRITINGTAIKEPYLKPGDSASDQDFDITVPSGRVWVMGDHRSNSADSRAHDGPTNNGSQGSVDEHLIVGRAVALVWPLDRLTWLSNPTATFAKVPAPSAGSGGAPRSPAGTSGQGNGGGEVGGTDTPTGSG